MGRFQEWVQRWQSARRQKREDHPRKAASVPARDEAWYVVATTSGIMEAAIIAGRLHSLNIPAVVHREAAGAALGLVVGALGQAQVLVPHAYYAFAKATLDPDESLPALDDGTDADWDDSP